MIKMFMTEVKNRKFSVINSVPINAGDELLLNVAIRLIKGAGLRINSVHSNQRDLAGDIVPEYNHFWDLDQAAMRDFGFMLRGPIRGLLQRMKICPMWPIIAGRHGRLTRLPYEALSDSDWIFSAPGGYLNSRYGYRNRLWAFEKCLNLGKSLVLMPQSIGPFDKNENHGKLIDVLSRARMVMVRDAVSFSYLEDIGYNNSNLTKWPDLGLLSGSFSNEVEQIEFNKSNRTILFCARKWKHRESPNALSRRLAGLLTALLSVGDTRVICASTCQGVNGYVDDSIFMSDIKNLVDPKYKNLISISKEHLRPNDYFKLAQQCDAYIGMRMHGAIIAMHARTPVLAIGYEDKTREIFSELNLTEYCVDMQASHDELCEKANYLIADLESARYKIDLALSHPRYKSDVFATNFGNAIGLA